MSLFFKNRLHKFCRDKAGDVPPAGAGADPKPDDKAKPADSAKELADLKASNAALLARLEALEGKNTNNDDDLNAKAKAIRDKEATDKTNHKALEEALTFNMSSKTFITNNKNLLPSEIEDIFKAADKETYESAVDKANDIKSGIVQEFFKVQANLDLLTPGQKTILEDYLKLTKNGKQEKATSVYLTIFEPAFEMLKQVKRAEAINKGHGSSSDAQSAYKKKLIEGSRKHYLGEKSNA